MVEGSFSSWLWIAGFCRTAQFQMVANSSTYYLSRAELYQDSMAIAWEFGPASYLLTVTVNPNWQEIQSELLPGQTANDCPDLVVHVFHKKLSLPLRHLKSILGHQVACVYVIEYQEDGLMPISYFGFQLFRTPASLTLLKTWATCSGHITDDPSVLFSKMSESQGVPINFQRQMVQRL